MADDDDELVLPNIVPADPASGKSFWYEFPPWPRVPGLLRIDQFEPKGLQNQSWPAGEAKPEPQAREGGSDSSDDDDGEDDALELDGYGRPTVNLHVEHNTVRKSHRSKTRAGGARKKKKPRAPRLQMLRKGIVRTEDLLGPGGWEGSELVETRGKEAYDVTTPALLRVQRAAREFASSRVHVINSEQALMQIWAAFLTFAELEKRKAEERPESAEDYDSDLDSIPEDGCVMYHPEGDLLDEEPETSRFVDDMEGTVRMFLSSVFRARGLHWEESRLKTGPQVVWSFVKYVKAHGVLPEPAFQSVFDRVQRVCEQAREEMVLTKLLPMAFEDGCNLMCSRVWGKRLDEYSSRPWVVEAEEAEKLLAETASSPNETNVEATGGIDMVTPPAPNGTPMTSLPSATSPTAQPLSVDAGGSFEWQIEVPVDPAATSTSATGDVTPDPWNTATLQPGWELEWDVSEYTVRKPTSFLDPILGGGVADGEWGVACEVEALLRIVAVGVPAREVDGVKDHPFMAQEAHALEPVVLEEWLPSPKPFKRQAFTGPDEAYLARSGAEGGRSLVVWMERDQVDAGKIKAGMGLKAALKLLKREDGRVFWFVDSVPIAISNFWLASPLTADDDRRL